MTNIFCRIVEQNVTIFHLDTKVPNRYEFFRVLIFSCCFENIANPKKLCANSFQGKKLKLKNLISNLQNLRAIMPKTTACNKYKNSF